MKKLLIAILILATSTAWAGPPITQGINTGALGAITASSITDTGLTASLPVFTDGSKVLVSKSQADTQTFLGLGTAAYTASTAYQAAGTTQGSMTCLSFGGMSTCQYAAASLANNGTITLPTATGGWPLRCEIEAGDDADSAYFTVTSGGTASPISSSAGIVFNAGTASKVQVGAAAPANPLVITNASGGALNIWVSCKYK